LVLPHANVPLRFVAADDLSAQRAPDGRPLDRQCPGPDADRILICGNTP